LFPQLPPAQIGPQGASSGLPAFAPGGTPRPGGEQEQGFGGKFLDELLKALQMPEVQDLIGSSIAGIAGDGRDVAEFRSAFANIQQGRTAAEERKFQRGRDVAGDVRADESLDLQARGVATSEARETRLGKQEAIDQKNEIATALLQQARKGIPGSTRILGENLGAEELIIQRFESLETISKPDQFQIPEEGPDAGAIFSAGSIPGTSPDSAGVGPTIRATQPVPASLADNEQSRVLNKLEAENVIKPRAQMTLTEELAERKELVESFPEFFTGKGGLFDNEKQLNQFIATGESGDSLLDQTLQLLTQTIRQQSSTRAATQPFPVDPELKRMKDDLVRREARIDSLQGRLSERQILDPKTGEDKNIIVNEAVALNIANLEREAAQLRNDIAQQEAASDLAVAALARGWTAEQLEDSLIGAGMNSVTIELTLKTYSKRVGAK